MQPLITNYRVEYTRPDVGDKVMTNIRQSAACSGVGDTLLFDNQGNPSYNYVAARRAAGDRSAFKIEGDDFVQLDGWHLDHERAAVMAKRDFFSGHEKASARDVPPICRTAEADSLRTHGNDFANGPLEHHGVGQVDEVGGEGVLLPPE
jgi:hypothetical protein